VRWVSCVGCYSDVLPEYSQVEFGSGASSHCLLATTSCHLLVWDLLSCSGEEVGVVSHGCSHVPVLCRELARASVCSQPAGISPHLDCGCVL